MNPSFIALQSNVIALFDAVDICAERKHPLATLMLVYSGMDVIASLEREPKEGVGACFARWTEKYLLSDSKLGCTGLELFAARCGILHSFSADSDLYRAGKARRVMYAWGTASKDDLSEAATRLRRNDCVSIHVTELLDAFRTAVGNYFTEVGESDHGVNTVLENAGMWLVNMDPGLVREFLQRTAPRADT